MARTYQNKGIHTKPETAGEQNIKNIQILPKDENGLNEKLLPVRLTGKENQIYKGHWTTELLEQKIDEFFNYCCNNNIKPNQPLLRIWLGISKSTFNEWKSPSKNRDKSVVLERALDIMEVFLLCNIDTHPTGTIFLLKTSYGYVETSKMDLTTNGSAACTSEEIIDMVNKLGLNNNILSS